MLHDVVVTRHLDESTGACGVAQPAAPHASRDRVMASSDDQDGRLQGSVPVLGRVIDHVPRLLQVPPDSAAEIVREHDQVDERRLADGVGHECPGLGCEAAMAAIHHGTDRDDGLYVLGAMQDGLCHPLHAHRMPDDDASILPQRRDHLRERPSHPRHIRVAERPGQPREARQVHGHDVRDTGEDLVQSRQVPVRHPDAVDEHDGRRARTGRTRTLPQAEHHPIRDDATMGRLHAVKATARGRYASGA